MKQRTVASIALLGLVAIAIDDAPDWEFESFAGWLGAMVGLVIINEVNSSLATPFGMLMLAAVLLRRGTGVAGKIGEWSK